MTDSTPPLHVVDSLTLRFQGRTSDGDALHELRAAHVAEVLQGLVELESDFAKAGAFGDGPAGAEVLVRPPEQGSWQMEVVRLAAENAEWFALGTPPSLGQVLWWATRSARAEVADFDFLEDGMVKINWTDGTAQHVPRAAFDELQKRTRRRKKQLAKIMAPLSADEVTSLEIIPATPPDAPEETEPPATFVLEREDYDAVRPEDEIEETTETIEVEAQMSAIDFDDPTRWKVKTVGAKRNARLEDKDFLQKVSTGLAIRKSDIFRLRIREDVIVKNGRSRTTWVVLSVLSHRRAVHDDDA